MKTKNDKIQKRSIEVVEYENGKFKIVGSVWNLDNLNAEDVEDAFIAWKKGELREECSIKIKPPRMISN